MNSDPSSPNFVRGVIQRSRENIFMQLLYANCVPKLTYGAEVKDLNSSEMNQYNVALNGAIRRIFGFRYWQSICQLRECYGFKSMEELFEKAKRRFFNSILYHDNNVLKFLASLLHEERETESSRIP